MLISKNELIGGRKQNHYQKNECRGDDCMNLCRIFHHVPRKITIAKTTQKPIANNSCNEAIIISLIVAEDRNSTLR